MESGPMVWSHFLWLLPKENGFESQSRHIFVSLRQHRSWRVLQFTVLSTVALGEWATGVFSLEYPDPKFSSLLVTFNFHSDARNTKTNIGPVNSIYINTKYIRVFRQPECQRETFTTVRVFVGQSQGGSTTRPLFITMTPIAAERISESLSLRFKARASDILSDRRGICCVKKFHRRRFEMKTRELF